MIEEVLSPVELLKGLNSLDTTDTYKFTYAAY